MKFSEKIVVLRKIKGITQDELASAVGVSRQAVYKWECGQSYPEVSKLIELKLLFNISIDDLLDESYEIARPEKKKRKRLPRAEMREIEREVMESLENETVTLAVSATNVSEEVTAAEEIPEPTVIVEAIEESVPMSEEASIAEEASVTEEVSETVAAEEAIEESAPVSEEASIAEEATVTEEVSEPAMAEEAIEESAPVSDETVISEEAIAADGNTEAEPSVTEAPVKKKGFFGRLFGRK